VGKIVDASLNFCFVIEMLLEMSHFWMIIAQYKHQTKQSSILEYSLMPFSLVLFCRPWIFHRSSFTVFGGACKI
jgi:hypothetical protein